MRCRPRGRAAVVIPTILRIPVLLRDKAAYNGPMNTLCEIIYVKDARARGWKWRLIAEPGKPAPQPSQETFELFYECVSAARAKGYRPNVKCL